MSELVVQRFGVRLAVRSMGTYLARWGYTPQKGSVTVTRAATDGNFPPAEEAMLDVELILTKGDFLFIEDASQDWMRNAGDDELVLFIAALNPVGQDFGILLSEMDTGTPTT